MITRERLDQVLRKRSGDLEETPYPVLLLALALREKTALLSLRHNPLQKEIVFDDGSPVDCRSNIATETFGRFLVGAGKLSESDYHAALSLSASRGVPLEEILTERKLIPPTELYRVMQQSLGRKLLEPFSWKRGTYQISYDVPPTESALHVKVPQLIITGILKVEPQESADEAVAKGKYLALAPNPLFELDELRLSAEQQTIVDAARNRAEIRSIAGVAEDDAHRIIYALLLLGVVKLTQHPMRSAPMFELDHPFRAPTVETPAPPLPPPPAPPPPPKVSEKVAEEIMAAYLAFRRKDAFDLLGVGERDGPLEFTRAFLRMAEKFVPWQFEEKTPDGLREKSQEVFLAAARAYGELMDSDRRDALLQKRLQKRQPAPPAAVKPITAERPLGKEGLIDPEALCRNGRELAAAGKLREALSSFEMAAECDAQNGTYAAEVAWTRFQLMATPATNALKQLKNAIRIDPRSGIAHLYAAKVLAALGNRMEAESYLNRAAMLMPKDLRVVEALKALR